MKGRASNRAAWVGEMLDVRRRELLPRRPRRPRVLRPAQQLVPAGAAARELPGPAGDQAAHACGVRERRRLGRGPRRRVACVEFHSKLQPKVNPIDDDIMDAIHQAIGIAEKDFRGLVDPPPGGAVLRRRQPAMILEGAMSQQWTAIDAMVRKFQAMTLGLQHARVPVVTAPFGLTLGGGAEITMAGDRVCALAETYMGLVEVGVGLIPAGGGHVYMLERVLDGLDEPILSNCPFLRKAFENDRHGEGRDVGGGGPRAQVPPAVRRRRDQPRPAAVDGEAHGDRDGRGGLPPAAAAHVLPSRPRRPRDPPDDAPQHEDHPLDLRARREDRDARRQHPVRRRHDDQQPRDRAGDPRPRARGLPLPAAASRRRRSGSSTC